MHLLLCIPARRGLEGGDSMKEGCLMSRPPPWLRLIRKLSLDQSVAVSIHWHWRCVAMYACMCDVWMLVVNQMTSICPYYTFYLFLALFPIGLQSLLNVKYENVMWESALGPGVICWEIMLINCLPFYLHCAFCCLHVYSRLQDRQCLFICVAKYHVLTCR